MDLAGDLLKTCKPIYRFETNWGHSMRANWFNSPAGTDSPISPTRPLAHSKVRLPEVVRRVRELNGFKAYTVASRPVIATPAEIDIDNAEKLGQAIADASAGQPLVIVDMSGTRFCDSMGIRVLIRSTQHISANGGELRLVAPSPTVLRSIGLIGADGVLRIFSNMSEAVKQGARKPS